MEGAGERVAVTTAVPQPNHVSSEVVFCTGVQLATKMLCFGQRETDLGSQSSALFADNALSPDGRVEIILPT